MLEGKASRAGKGEDGDAGAMRARGRREAVGERTQRVLATHMKKIQFKSSVCMSSSLKWNVASVS